MRHLCGNSHCINPLHLVRGTVEDNADDDAAKAYYVSVGIENMIREELPEVSVEKLTDRGNSCRTRRDTLVSNYMIWCRRIGKHLSFQDIIAIGEVEWRQSFELIVQSPKWLYKIFGVDVTTQLEQEEYARKLLHKLRHNTQITVVEVNL